MISVYQAIKAKKYTPGAKLKHAVGHKAAKIYRDITGLSPDRNLQLEVVYKRKDVKIVAEFCVAFYPDDFAPVLFNLIEEEVKQLKSIAKKKSHPRTKSFYQKAEKKAHQWIDKKNSLAPAEKSFTVYKGQKDGKKIRYTEVVKSLQKEDFLCAIPL